MNRITVGQKKTIGNILRMSYHTRCIYVESTLKVKKQKKTLGIYIQRMSKHKLTACEPNTMLLNKGTHRRVCK